MSKKKEAVVEEWRRLIAECENRPRQDNIWICKSRLKVSLSNMYEDYQIRPELLKSKQYYNNAFQTAVDYDALMNLKKALKK